MEKLGSRFQELTVEDLPFRFDVVFSFSAADSSTESGLESVGGSTEVEAVSFGVLSAGEDKAAGNQAPAASCMAAWRSHNSACKRRTLPFSARVGAPARWSAVRNRWPPAKMLGPAIVALLAQVAPERSRSFTCTPPRWLLIMFSVHGSSVSIFKPRVNFRTHFEHEPSGAQCTRNTIVTSGTHSRDMLVAEVEPLIRSFRKVILTNHRASMHIFLSNKPRFKVPN